MKLAPIPPHTFIDNNTAWQKCLKTLRKEPILAIDLESNSMYVYQEQICLIQISTPDQDFIIDPLTKIDLSGLGELVEDPAVQKIFHAAEYDMILMKQEHKWNLQNLFDTMWAARILGYDKVGLANMLDELFEVKLDKRFQRTDWGKRPLSADQLAYAQRDTHYLFRLRARLKLELEKAGAWEEAQEIFEEQSNIKLRDNSFNADEFWNWRGVRRMSRPSQAILKGLAIYRDEEAFNRNLPLFKVMGNKTLIQIAENMPRNLKSLSRIKGMNSRQVQRHGTAILNIIQRYRRGPFPIQPDRPPRPSDAILSRYDTMHNWRKQRGIDRGVESDIIISKDALWEIAQTKPQTLEELAKITGVGPWRLKTYGEEILQVVNGKA